MRAENSIALRKIDGERKIGKQNKYGWMMPWCHSAGPTIDDRRNSTADRKDSGSEGHLSIMSKDVGDDLT